MGKILKLIPPASGVAYGAAPRWDIPLGPRYHAFYFEIIATAAANKTLTRDDVAGLINFFVNDKVQRQHTARELDSIQTSYRSGNAALNLNYDAGAANFVPGVGVFVNTNGNIALQPPQTAKQTMFQIPVYLAAPWRKSYAARDIEAWYTKWQKPGDATTVKTLSSFQIELNIPAASANVLAASAITVNLYAMTDDAVGPVDANGSPIIKITKWIRSSLAYAGAGDALFNKLRQNGDLYQQMSLFASYKAGPANPPVPQTDFDSLSYAKIERNGRTLREVTKIQGDFVLLNEDFSPSQALPLVTCQGRDALGIAGNANVYQQPGLPQDRLDIPFDITDFPNDAEPVLPSDDFRLTARVGVVGTGIVSASKSISLISLLYGAFD